jgi:hypothetical protein
VQATRIVPSVRLDAASPREVAREFRALLARGVALRPSGAARRDPERLLARGYEPSLRIRLFDATYYLTELREDPSWEGVLRFFVAYVLPTPDSPALYPRLFEKDYSLVWRSPTHFIRSARENWMGKGALREYVAGGETLLASAEETTNLPLELQAALDDATRRTKRPRRDGRAVELVVRRAPDGRLEPYADFSAPRREAAAAPGGLVNRGRPIARFARANAPGSLRFAKGYEPDFARGVLEETRSGSGFYGGAIRKLRILSRNRRIQYQFCAAPRHAWIVPPQTLSTRISSYGLRLDDVVAPDELCVPGFEYCYLDTTLRPPRLHSQIPDGFAGEPSALDPARRDASAWLERLPPIREFRARVLARRTRARPRMEA